MPASASIRLSAPKPISAIEPAAIPAPRAIANSTTCQAIPPQASRRARRSSFARSTADGPTRSGLAAESACVDELDQGSTRLRTHRHEPVPPKSRCRTERMRGAHDPRRSVRTSPSFRRAASERGQCVQGARAWWDTRFWETLDDPGEVAARRARPRRAGRRRASGGSDRKAHALYPPPTRQRSGRAAVPVSARRSEGRDRGDPAVIGHSNILTLVVMTGSRDTTAAPRARPS